MKIIIIEDETLLATKTAIKLERKGFSVDIFNGYNDFKMNFQYDADLYLIDLSLGDGDGFEIIKYLRNITKSKSPIMITSGYNDDEKKIYGLNLGADDYLAKPYSPEILVARVNALIRRSYNINNESIILYKTFEFNISNKILKKGNIEISLRARESLLVEYLLLNVSILITKNEFINYVWGSHENNQVTDNSINVIVSRVRKKLGDDFDLETVINKGYLLRK